MAGREGGENLWVWLEKRKALKSEGSLLKKEGEGVQKRDECPGGQFMKKGGRLAGWIVRGGGGPRRSYDAENGRLAERGT